LGPNREQIFDLIQTHPEGLDDDDISELAGIRPRQQVQQLCNQLAAVERIRRLSVSKAGKRRKIHNFPIEGDATFGAVGTVGAPWRRRLAVLVAATGKSEQDILDEALQALAIRILADSTVKS
jgi:hypothetical protein